MLSVVAFARCSRLLPFSRRALAVLPRQETRGEDYAVDRRQTQTRGHISPRLGLLIRSKYDPIERNIIDVSTCRERYIPSFLSTWMTPTPPPLWKAKQLNPNFREGLYR
jgi:hypothetical protein